MKMFFLLPLLMGVNYILCMQQQMIIEDLSASVSAQDYRRLQVENKPENDEVIVGGEEEVPPCHEGQPPSESDYLSLSDLEAHPMRFTRGIERDPLDNLENSSSSTKKKRGVAVAAGVAVSVVAAAGTYLAARFLRTEASQSDERKFLIQFEDGKITTIKIRIEELHYFGIFEKEGLQDKDSRRSTPIKVGVTEQQFITLLRYISMLIEHKEADLVALLVAECDMNQMISCIEQAELLDMKELLGVLLEVFASKLRKLGQKNFSAAIKIVESLHFSVPIQHELKERIYPCEQREHFISLIHTRKTCKGLLSIKALGENHYYLVAKVGGNFEFELYDSKTRRLLDAFQFPEEICSVAFCQGELIIITRSRVYFIDLETRKFTSTFGIRNSDLNSFGACLAFSDKPMIALGLTSQVMLIDRQGRRSYFLNSGDMNAVSLEFSKNGSTLAELGKSGQLNFWDAGTQQLLGKSLAEHNPDRVVSTGTADFLTCNEEGLLDKWSSDGKHGGSVPLGGKLLCVDPLRNRFIVTVDEVTNLVELDMVTLTISTQQLPGNGRAMKAAFSTQGQHVAVLRADNMIDCYTVGDLTKKASLRMRKSSKDLSFNQAEHLIVRHDNEYSMWYLFDDVLTYLRNPEDVKEALLYAHSRLLLYRDEPTLIEISIHLLKGKEEGLKALFDAIW